MAVLNSVGRKGPAVLYVEGDDLGAVISAVKSAEIYLPVRKTFYGAKAIRIKDPAGHFVTFAQFATPPRNICAGNPPLRLLRSPTFPQGC
jgi:hypothetical protein